MAAIVIAGPPRSGVERVARRVAEESSRRLVVDGDVKDMHHLGELLESDVVLATHDYAHIVHQFVAADRVAYVFRKIEDIERELELAEYDQDADIGFIVRDITNGLDHPRQAFDQIVDLTQSLPRILYQWWGWQKRELEFWHADAEEVEYTDCFTSSVVLL